MKIHKIIWYLLLPVIGACNVENDITDLKEENIQYGEMLCEINTESNSTRTYYEISDNFYRAKWDKGDQIALCFDNSRNAQKFTLYKGEYTPSATFRGPLPDNYNFVRAIYPSDIYKYTEDNNIAVCIKSPIIYNVKQILKGMMPMYAQSSDNILNFYNLMGAVKVSVKGSGLLKGLNISSLDGCGICGNGHIAMDDNNIPTLIIDESDKSLNVNIGSVFLSSEPYEVIVPIPANTYKKGLKLDFIFDNSIESRILDGELHFERSVLRSVKPYDINVSFDFDSYTPKDNEIWYKSSKLQKITNVAIDKNDVITQSYSNGMGLITTNSSLTKIKGQLFMTPEDVDFIILPNTIEEIAMDGLKHTAITEFIAPEHLKSLGTDAFMHCDKLKNIVLNDGCESLDLEVFGDCPNLEHVYIPKSITTIGAYCFRSSTGKLDHWDGDCEMIDDDRHAIYANTAYDIYDNSHIMIDAIAGCNLTEYKIPSNALQTQNYAFEGCNKLNKLIIHENFKKFGVENYNTLPELETIICYSLYPPTMEEFSQLSKLKAIYIPKESIDEYKNANGWKNFSDIILPLKQ